MQTKSDCSHKRRESDNKNAVAIEICISDGLRLARLGRIGFSKRQTSPGKPDAKCFGTKSKNTIHTVYVMQVSEKNKDRRLEKYKSKFLISEVFTKWNLRTDLKNILKDKSDLPVEMLGTLPIIFKSSKKRRKLHSTRLRKNGDYRQHQQKSRWKDSLW